MRVAFLGLGQMGFPMAGHLAARGHAVTVYNRSRAKSELWRSTHDGAIAATAAQAVAEAEIVCLCLADIAATREVLLHPGGALAEMRPGALLVDHSSATPDFARELHTLAATRSVRFLDAPVTGGVPGAQTGTLGIMVGGDAAACVAATPALQSYASKISLMGPPGAGHMTKLVNVICGIGMGEALAEALAFAKRAGLDMTQLIDLLMAGSSRSYILEHKGPAMAAGVHLPASFTVDLALNNIRQALDKPAGCTRHCRCSRWPGNSILKSSGVAAARWIRRASSPCSNEGRTLSHTKKWLVGKVENFDCKQLKDRCLVSAWRQISSVEELDHGWR